MGVKDLGGFGGVNKRANKRINVKNCKNIVIYVLYNIYVVA